MPLIQGYSPEAISENIARLRAEYYPEEQAVAIALETARKAWRKAHKSGAYPYYLKGVRAPRRKRRKTTRPKYYNGGGYA